MKKLSVEKLLSNVFLLLCVAEEYPALFVFVLRSCLLSPLEEILYSSLKSLALIALLLNEQRAIKVKRNIDL
jgi:hypothetical protein